MWPYALTNGLMVPAVGEKDKGKEKEEDKSDDV